MTTLWRAFPWDRRAAAGAPFSPSFVPRSTGRGRFDLPPDRTSVLYLAESPEHAVAELLHPWRGRRIDDRHLVRAGHPLTLVPIEDGSDRRSLADLCDPAVLSALGIAPDQVASRHRAVTQPIARQIWDGGHTGLRWWSSFWGDWHTTVIFAARRARHGSGGALRFGEPEPLTRSHGALTNASRLLGIEVAG